MPFILTCTDGSAYASSVYDHAAWAAGRLSASVRVAHVSDPGERTDVSPTKRGAATAILSSARHHLARAGAQDVETFELQGVVSECIVTAASGAVLVVLGKRGENSDLVRNGIGRQVESVVRHCDVPLLVAARQYRPIARALLAFDGSESAEKAVAYAAREPLCQNVVIHLVAADRDRPELAAELDRARERLAAAGRAVTSERGQAYPDILIAAIARRLEVDLLIMGAFGHSRLRNMVMGSTTKTMLQALPISALLFR